VSVYSAEQSDEILRLYRAAYLDARRQLKHALKHGKAVAPHLGKAVSMYGMAMVGFGFKYGEELVQVEQAGVDLIEEGECSAG